MAEVSSTRLYLGNLPRDGKQSDTNIRLILVDKLPSPFDLLFGSTSNIFAGRGPRGSVLRPCYPRHVLILSSPPHSHQGGYPNPFQGGAWHNS